MPQPSLPGDESRNVALTLSLFCLVAAPAIWLFSLVIYVICCVLTFGILMYLVAHVFAVVAFCASSVSLAGLLLAFRSHPLRAVGDNRRYRLLNFVAVNAWCFHGLMIALSMGIEYAVYVKSPTVFFDLLNLARWYVDYWL